MSMPFTNTKTPMVTRDIIERGFLKKAPFFLVDVGASGGIGHLWDSLGSDIKAIGIDPLLKECERLQKNEKRASVKYVSAFIVAEKEEDQIQFIPQECCDYFKRSSADYSLQNKSMNFIKENFNSGEELAYSKEKVTLDELLKEESDKVNFLKVDTDGFDISVLKGASKTLSSEDAIAAVVECQFLGEKGSNSNVFSNIERYLADYGFIVYSMDVNRYSRKHLPSKFKNNLFAFTENGQVCWADVLFIKDPLKVAQLTKELAYKYLIIFELFNLHDCAAELLVERSYLFDSDLKQSYLEKLASQYYNNKATYRDAFKKITEEPEFYFPRNYDLESTNKVAKKIASKIITTAAPYFSRSFKDKIKNIISN